jgi:hypothetical protein
MNHHADFIDLLWCLVFGMTSIGGLLWFCRDTGFPI